MGAQGLKCRGRGPIPCNTKGARWVRITNKQTNKNKLFTHCNKMARVCMAEADASFAANGFSVQSAAADRWSVNTAGRRTTQRAATVTVFPAVSTGSSRALPGRTASEHVCGGSGSLLGGVQWCTLPCRHPLTHTTTSSRHRPHRPISHQPRYIISCHIMPYYCFFLSSCPLVRNR